MIKHVASRSCLFSHKKVVYIVLRENFKISIDMRSRPKIYCLSFFKVKFYKEGKAFYVMYTGYLFLEHILLKDFKQKSTSECTVL